MTSIPKASVSLASNVRNGLRDYHSAGRDVMAGPGLTGLVYGSDYVGEGTGLYNDRFGETEFQVTYDNEADFKNKAWGLFHSYAHDFNDPLAPEFEAAVNADGQPGINNGSSAPFEQFERTALANVLLTYNDATNDTPEGKMVLTASEIIQAREDSEFSEKVTAEFNRLVQESLPSSN